MRSLWLVAIFFQAGPIFFLPFLSSLDEFPFFFLPSVWPGFYPYLIIPASISKTLLLPDWVTPSQSLLHLVSWSIWFWAYPPFWNTSQPPFWNFLLSWFLVALHFSLFPLPVFFLSGFCEPLCIHESSSTLGSLAPTTGMLGGHFCLDVHHDPRNLVHLNWGHLLPSSCFPPSLRSL